VQYIYEVYTLHILEIGLKAVKNAMHINVDSGCGKFDCAYDWVVR